MQNWIKSNWLVGLLTLIVLVAATVMVLTMIENSETLGTEIGYAIMAMTVAVVVFLILALKRPDKVTALRVNLIWLSSLVAILTLVFGNKLISILTAPAGDSAGTANGVNTNTIEIVLSSLVGVGIGGLIAIAGQLVQDSGQGPNRNEQSGNADRSQKDDLDGPQGTK